jgi:predicted RNase H-like HicB family nuclease
MYYNYKVIIEECEECEEGGYYAECPAFPGCHVEGDTYEQTISELKEAIKVFVDDYKKRNKKLPIDNFSVASIQVAV